MPKDSTLIHHESAATKLCCVQDKPCSGKQGMAWVWELVPDPTYVKPTQAPVFSMPTPRIRGERGFCGLIH